MFDTLDTALTLLGGGIVGGLTVWLRASHVRRQVSNDSVAVQKNDTEMTLLAKALIEREECLKREREDTRLIATLRYRIAIKHEQHGLALREARRLRRALSDVSPEHPELMHSDFSPLDESYEID